MNREKPEKIRDEFLQHIWDLVKYWDEDVKGKSTRERLEGLASSILASIDDEEEKLQESFNSDKYKLQYKKMESTGLCQCYKKPDTGEFAEGSKYAWTRTSDSVIVADEKKIWNYYSDIEFLQFFKIVS